MAGWSCTELLVGITQLVKLLPLQVSQVPVVLCGIFTIFNLAGGKFFSTDNAFPAVSSAAFTATTTSVGVVSVLGMRGEGQYVSVGA